MDEKNPAGRESETWYRIRLTRDEYEGGEVAVIRGTFRRIYIARNGPKGMAMYGTESDDETAYFVYFTPESLPHVRVLIKAYSAEPHAPPPLRRLSLIFGEEPNRT
ncbi:MULTISPECIES: hypothetical protein [unclassified Methylocaldum]|uniref:hypothetical protein n=1 Tax=unclassified Methylocaldum TaxID=2622260 RepID=UPI00098A0F95|nr:MULTISPECIES: hypothetical protein [unclassified Methylocaldum]MBP1151739.1 hypothetical protein [Methylocaldum sp. RMAD-M]